jgi:hypothetical protein
MLPIATSTGTTTGDTSVFLSEDMLRQMDRPYEIFMSARKIWFRIALFLFSGVAICALLFSMQQTKWSIGVAIISLLAITGQVLQFRYVKQAIIVVSKSGLHLRTRKFDKMMAWSTIVENTWLDSYRVIKTGSLLTLRAGNPPKGHMIPATCFDIDRDEYIRVCSLYAAAAGAKNYD